MTKTRIVEFFIILVSLGVAVRLAFELADHGVPVAAIVSVVMTTLASGIFFAAKVGDAAKIQLFQCTIPGCPTMIRAQHVSADEAQRLRSLAADHARHAG